MLNYWLVLIALCKKSIGKWGIFSFGNQAYQYSWAANGSNKIPLSMWKTECPACHRLGCTYTLWKQSNEDGGGLQGYSGRRKHWRGLWDCLQGPPGTVNLRCGCIFLIPCRLQHSVAEHRRSWEQSSALGPQTPGAFWVGGDHKSASKLCTSTPPTYICILYHRRLLPSGHIPIQYSFLQIHAVCGRVQRCVRSGCVWPDLSGVSKHAIAALPTLCSYYVQILFA